MPTWIWRFMIQSENIASEEKESIIDVYHSMGRDAFYEAAKKKKVLPFVACTMVRIDVDTTFWNGIAEEFRQRNLVILKVLDEAYGALQRNGVRKMFVSENFGALLSANQDIALFASGDVDNYADPCEKEKIYRAFEEIGYQRKERYSGKHQIAAEFFPPDNIAGLPEKFYISVDFYPLARLKLPCFIRADEFVAWDELTTYQDTSVVLPPPTALMYICLLHISLHSFSRAPDIRLYIDLLNMARLQVNYMEIEKWCRRDAVCTRAAVSADICNRMLKTSIPDSIVGLSDRRYRVMKKVYLPEQNDLKYEPKRFQVLAIELACDDKSDLHGLLMILFPDSFWMAETYGSSGFLAHMKHFLKVF